jgi:transcriptional regulator with XRE-family HTH domain
MWSLSTTRLETFLREWGVMSTVFARRAGISANHLIRLRRGETEPTRRMMVTLAETASAMLSRPVYIIEMFDLSRADEAVYAALMERKSS